MTATEARALLSAYASLCRAVDEHLGSGRRLFELIVIAGGSVRTNVYRDTAEAMQVAELRLDGRSLYAFGDKRPATADELAQIEVGSNSAQVAS